VDELIDALEFFMGSYFGPARREKVPEKAKAMIEALAKTDIPRLFGQVEKVLERNGCKEHHFAAIPRLTIADLKLYYSIRMWESGKIDGIPTTILEPFHLIQTYKSHVEKEIEKFTKCVGK